MAILDEPELLAYLQQEQQASNDTAINSQVATALDFYQGEPFGDEVEGSSALVTRDVAEAVDYMTTSILGTVISGDKVISFEARDKANLQAVDDATEVIHYQFMRQQDGYRLIHDWIKAGLLEKNGIVKTFVQREFEKVTLEVPVEAIEQGEGDKLTIDGMEVLESVQIAHAMQSLDQFGNVVGETSDMFRVKIKRPLPTKFRDALVPSEQFGAAADARDLDGANYCFNMVRKSLSDLRKMGFEFEDAELHDDSADVTSIPDARDAQRSKKDRDVYHTGPMRRVWLREEYAHYDRDGDGIAELLCIHRVGTKILAIEECDEHPYEEWTPFPMTARRVGQSLADKVMDVQRVRSVLLRQAMNSLYLSTNPRTLISEDALTEDTIDDILTPRSGALIRYKGSVPPTPWGTLPVHEQAFAGMQMMSEEMQGRTGITPLNQGLDADVFNRTATGTALLQSQGQQIELYIARNFVEAFARLAMKKYRLMRKFGTPIRIQVDGQFRDIDPTTWPEEIDIRIKVGLGTGNKDKKIQALQLLVESGNEALQQGLPIVTMENVYNATRALITEFQVGNPSDFVTEPPKPQMGPDGQPVPQQPKPDPEVIKAQTEQMAAQADAQRKSERQQADIAMEQQAANAKAEIAAQAAAQESQLRRDKAAEEARLAQDKADFEKGMAVERFNFDTALAARQAAQDRQLVAAGDDDLPANRPGGDLAE